jgi:hypothetical protein
MTEVSHDDVFVDRRTADQKAGELATPVLFWYDEEGKGRKRRRRTNGVAITTGGELVWAEAVCSRKDQFVKAQGRMVVEKRILGHAQTHAGTFMMSEDGERCEAAANAYRDDVSDDEVGVKRAYNAGRIFDRYKADIERRANELDNFNG